MSSSRLKTVMRSLSKAPFGLNLIRRSFWLLCSIILLLVLACGGAPTGTPEPVIQSESGTVAESDTNATLSRTPDSPTSGVDAEATTDAPGTVDETAIEQHPLIPPDVPMVDRNIHSVPLEDIVFDTFGGSPLYLPLDQASDQDLAASGRNQTGLRAGLRGCWRLTVAGR